MTGGTFLACLHLIQRARRPGAIGLTRLCDIPVGASDIPASASDIPVVLVNAGHGRRFEVVQINATYSQIC